MSFVTFPLTVPDTYVMTASFWFKVEGAVGISGGFLMDFGNPAGPQGASSISISSVDASDSINVYLASGAGVVTTDITSSSLPPDVITGDTGQLQFSSKLMSLRDNWNHVFFACDFNVNETQPPIVVGSGAYYVPKVRLWINGENAQPSAGIPDIIYALTPSGKEAGVGLVNPTPLPTTPPFTYYTIRPWKIAINGFNFGVPSLPEDDFPEQPIVQFAAMQVWFDQYIDPTPTNLSKFINATTGELIRPEVAQEYFGRSQILFDGGKDFFHLNQVGGTTTLYGEGEDVDPYPLGLDVPVA